MLAAAVLVLLLSETRIPMVKVEGAADRCVAEIGGPQGGVAGTVLPFCPPARIITSIVLAWQLHMIVSVHQLQLLDMLQQLSSQNECLTRTLPTGR